MTPLGEHAEEEAAAETHQLIINFWGDLPEEEFYAGQGVRNTKGFFKTSNANIIFTHSFLPLHAKPKAIVCLNHGYASHTDWLFQLLSIALAQWGYAAFSADLLGHGRSHGLPGYIHSAHELADSSLSFFRSVRDSDEFRHLPAFLLGESLGAAVSLLMHSKDPQGWDGAIVAAPLIIMPDEVKPPRLLLTAYEFLLGFADTWAVFPVKGLYRKAIRDPERAELMLRDPRMYKGAFRVGTMRELCALTLFLQQNLHTITIPFLAMHGTEDSVTDPQSSRILFEKASSKDKSLKLYEGAYHCLLNGEPEETRNAVLKDIKEWLDERAGTVVRSRNV